MNLHPLYNYNPFEAPSLPKTTTKNELNTDKFLDFFQEISAKYLQTTSQVVITNKQPKSNIGYTMTFTKEAIHYEDRTDTHKTIVVINPMTTQITRNDRPMTREEMNEFLRKCRHIGRDIDEKKANVFEKKTSPSQP